MVNELILGGLWLEKSPFWKEASVYDVQIVWYDVY
jgi:hypothetical protein